MALGALALVLVGVAACSDSDDTPPATDSTPPSAAVDETALFSAVDPSPAASPDGSAYASRSRYAELNPAPLAQARETSPVEVTLNLFDDVTYTASLTFSDSGGFAQWTGELDGVELSTVVVVETDGVYSLQVASPEGAYLASPAPDGEGGYVVSELDADAFPEETELPLPDGR